MRASFHQFQSLRLILPAAVERGARPKRHWLSYMSKAAGPRAPKTRPHVDTPRDRYTHARTHINGEKGLDLSQSLAFHERASAANRWTSRQTHHTKKTDRQTQAHLSSPRRFLECCVVAPVVWCWLHCSEAWWCACVSATRGRKEDRCCRCELKGRGEVGWLEANAKKSKFSLTERERFPEHKYYRWVIAFSGADRRISPRVSQL